jgi:hypothetical protein
MGVNGRLFEIVRLRGGGFREFRPSDHHAVQGGEESAVVELPGPARYHELGEGCEEGVSARRQSDGDGPDLVEYNKGIECLVAEYRNEAQRM